MKNMSKHTENKPKPNFVGSPNIETQSSVRKYKSNKKVFNNF